MPTIVRSPSAIGVGVFFTLVTSWVLLEDVFRHGAPFTVKHLMTLSVLAGTVYFGHVLGREFWAGRFGNGLGCALLFLAGTVTCVLMSAGRNAEAVASRVIVAESNNGERERAVKNHAEVKGRYDAALEAERAECGSGDGVKCQSKRVLRKLRREDLDVAESLLRAQRPPQVANADIKAAASLIAKLPYVTMTEEAIEATLLLVQPFLLSLFCEAGAIVGYSIGLRPVPVRRTVQISDEPYHERSEPNGSRTVNPLAIRQDDALADLLGFISANGPVSSQEALRARWGLRSKGTVSTWLGEWEGLALIVRRPVGREKVIDLPTRL